MTTRNLEALFSPRAIALIGASNQPGSVGLVLASNLLAGGFSGPVMLVNPHEDEICSVRSYKAISELPARPDLAILATPPGAIPGLIAQLGDIGCKAVIVITAGIVGDLRQRMLDAARPHLMRIVGPNCLGMLSPVRGVNASFSHKAPPRGGLAFVTQSGAIATSIIDWALGKGIGFSHVLSLGDMADVDFGDLLDFLALDPETSAILLYAETITHARKFMSAGRIASRAKPVIVVKGGRSAAGARAAASHTGALAGADAVYDAVFRRAGMLRVGSLRSLFDAAETLASGLQVRGQRLMVLTNGGGLGVLAADALEQAGGELSVLTGDAIARLNDVLPSSWPHANPVDILGDAQGSRYEAALGILAAGHDSDGLLVMNCPTGVADSLDAARATVRVKDKNPRQPMLACWMGEASTVEPRRILSEAGIPNYETPDEAVQAFAQLGEYARNQKALYETPVASASPAPRGRDDVHAVINAVLAEGRAILTELEAKAVLSAYGIPVVETLAVATPEAAADAASRLTAPFVLKILSRQITHKSDIGGVKLALSDSTAVGEAAREMLGAVARARPDAVIDGFTVQPMIRRPHAEELLLGAVVDATFGPCLLFGHGGVATEVIADRCVGLPPLNANLARELIERTRVFRLLSGYRNRAPARLDAIAGALVALSDLVIDFPEIAELDINPLLADADGIVALDARIIVRPVEAGAAQLAIRPYPSVLERRIDLSGLRLLLRPIRPDDGARLAAMAGRTAMQDLRMRFHAGVSALAPATAARLSQIDYDREMVFVAEEAGGDLGGVVRLVFDPNFDAAECAIIVRTDLQRRHVGRTLLAEALAYARARGAARIWGDVLSENGPALDLARRLGASVGLGDPESRLTRIEFKLA